MANYKKNSIITGSVTGIEKYGVFVTLDQLYSGLIHISEISDDYVRNIEDYVTIGETIKVKVLDIDEENHQLKLSIKNLKYKKTLRKRNQIVETSEGFKSLKNKLNDWIDQKIDYLNKK